MSEHCGSCGSQVCGHGFCPECRPCRECDGGDRENKQFSDDDYRFDPAFDGETAPGYGNSMSGIGEMLRPFTRRRL